MSPASHVPVDVAPAAVTPSPQPPAAAVASDMTTEQINHINEIFFYARRLLKDDCRFILNEREFLDAIEDVSLFLKSATGK
jgi:hypothetical protein